MHQDQSPPLGHQTLRLLLRSRPQNLFHLHRMLRKVINQMIPHTRLMLVPIPAPPREICNRKSPTILKHKCNRPHGNLHLRWLCFRRLLELLIRHPMRHHPALETHTAGLKLIRTSPIVPVDQPHQLRRNVAVEIRRAVRVARDILAGREDENIRERRSGIARSIDQDAEDRRVDMVDGYRPYVDKLRQIVLVRHIVVMPSHHIKRRMQLMALEELNPPAYTPHPTPHCAYSHTPLQGTESPAR
jgi:hypothetical protein